MVGMDAIDCSNVELLQLVFAYFSMHIQIANRLKVKVVCEYEYKIFSILKTNKLLFLRNIYRHRITHTLFILCHNCNNTLNILVVHQTNRGLETYLVFFVVNNEL